jgi:ribose transport system permease protein
MHGMGPFRRFFLAVRPETMLGAVLAVLVIYFSVTSDVFFSPINLRNVLLSVSVMGILAAPATLLLISGNFDLSIASAAAMCGVVAGMLIDSQGPAVAMAAALGIGLLAGLVNGFLVSVVGIASIIVTLGNFQAFRGVARLIANGQTIRMNDGIDFLTARILGVPTQIIIFVLISLIAVFVVRYTRFGRSVYAIGSNASAARLAGIRQRPAIFTLFVVSGLLAALAGLILASQLDAASPNAATGLELQVVAAVILGGASLRGGRGTILGTVLGVMILGVLQNGLTLLSISSFWRDVATGGVLILAVAVDQIRVRLGGQ